MDQISNHNDHPPGGGPFGKPVDYRSLFEAMDQGVCVAERIGKPDEHPDFLCVEANPAFTAQTGGRDLIGRPLGDLFSEDPAQAIATFDQVLATGEPTRFDCSMPALGTVLELRVSRLGAAGSNRIAVQLQDVTEYRRAGAALRESKARLRLIIESARDYAIFTADSEGLIETWPRGAEAVFGWRRDEAEGRPMAILFTPEDRQAGAPERELEIARQNGKAPDVRWHQCKDGHRVFIDGQTIALRDDRGTVRGFLKIGQDVTERRAAEQALRETEERFRQFGENSTNTLWIMDAKTLTIEYLSPAYEAMWGEPRERVLQDSRRWAELVHPDDLERAQIAQPRTIAGERIDSEYRIIRPDGAVRWIHDTGFPIRDSDGKVVRIAGIAQDITARRQAEELQATLLAELQHRVRNILAMTRAVARRTAQTTRDVDDYVDHLEGRISAMARVQTLLTREPGRGVDLRGLLLDELAAEAASEKQYRLTGPDVELGPKAAEVLSLAIHELATNSVKYGALSDAAGAVSVRWSVRMEGSERRLDFEWREPVVGEFRVPERRGFGTDLIERRVPYELRGSGRIDFSCEGVCATIEFPLVESRSILETAPAPGSQHER